MLFAALVFAAGCLSGCGKEKARDDDVVDSLAEPVGNAQTTAGILRTGPSDAGSEEKGSGSEETEGGEEKDMKTEETLEGSGRQAVFELLAGMNVGWNLGNTLDATGAGNSLSAETAWGNPKTTKEMIDTVAAEGFNTIRIPVTWAEHVGSAPDYTVDSAWMDRVEEVVDYCLDNDMYVILDTHHEPNYWLNPTADGLEEVKEELSAIWTQIAQRFASYDNRLLFEGMNEPRVRGSENEWNGGTEEEREAVNELNQVFIDAVRAVGGENEDRCLIICTYGNNAGYNAVKDLKIPEDDNIAVALHMYTPYLFTFEAEGGTDTWDGSGKAEIVETLKQVDKYLLKKDVPVIITEFGAMNKGNSGEIIKWIADYMSAMDQYGIKCVWWDNGNYSSQGEKFALLDRRNLTWYDKKIADALIENAK